MYVGVTDFDWFTYLKNQQCDEVNFWTPGGNKNFRALSENEMFLFKLHAPRNYIVGGGFFLYYQPNEGYHTTGSIIHYKTAFDAIAAYYVEKTRGLYRKKNRMK